MFIIYIKDLTSAFKNDNVSSCMYADDFAVQVQCKLPRLAEHVLHVTNTVIEDWTAANSLYINSNKTQTTALSLSSNEPNADCSVKFLSVAVKHNIKWNDRIVVCKRVAKSIFMIRKHRSVVSLDVLKAEYLVTFRVIYLMELLFGDIPVT